MSAQPPRRLTPALIALLAGTCGAALANNYYAQPLLGTIGPALGTSAATAALLVTASQLGYAAGILFISCLGDIVAPRTLVTRLLGVTAAGLVACAAAPSFPFLAAGLLWVGAGTVLAVVIVAFGGELAHEDERGRVVGTLLAGMLAGILVARTVSGLAAEFASWRVVYGMSAVAMAVLAVAVARVLPATAPRAQASYGSLLRSIVALVRTEPSLRRQMAYGALTMGAFTTLWTSLALLLSAPPFAYGEATIGLFGLVGLVGIAGAQIAGRVIDHGRAHAATGAFLAITIAGWVLCAFATSSLAALLLGIAVIDFGVQGLFTTTVSVVVQLRPEARSRLLTAFEAHLFLWGAVASAGAAAAWSAGGWRAVSAVGGAWVVAGVPLWLADRRSSRVVAKPNSLQ